MLTEKLEAAEADVRQRLEAALAHARDIMASADQDLTTQAGALRSLVETAQAGISATSQNAVAALSQDAERIEAEFRDRVDAALARAREGMAATDDGLVRQAEAVDALIIRSRASIDSISDETVSGLSDHMGEIEGRLHQIAPVRILVDEP